MKKLVSYTTVLSLLLAAGMGTDAIESKYKNNLLNVELGQTPDNKVSVLLVFEKPYSDPIKVSYKSENEYQILLPETYHSVTSVSAMNALNVRSANVKLVPYFNENKSNGYTKIIINTTRPVVFNAHASSLSSEKVAKNDLVKKLEKETTKKASAKPAKPQSTAKPAQKQETPKLAKAEPKKDVKSVTTTAPKKEIKQTKQSTENKIASAQQAKPKAETKAKDQPVKTESKKDVKPAQKQEIKQTAQGQKQEAKPAVQQPKPETKAEPKQEQPIKETKQDDIKQTETKPAVDTIDEEVTAENTEANEQIADNVEEKPIVTPQKQTSKIKTLAQNENSTLIVLIVSSFMLMLLLLKAFGKKTQKYTDKYNKFIKEHKEKEKPEIPETMKDMNWQEKYRQMKAKEEEKLALAEQIEKQEKQQEISNNLDNIFENSAAVSSPITESVIAPQTPAVVNVEPTITPMPEPAPAVEPEPDENIMAFNELENKVEYMEEPEIIYNEPQPETEQEETLIFRDNTQFEDEKVIDINNLTDDSFAISEEPNIENDIEILDLDNEPEDIAEIAEETVSNEPVFDAEPINFASEELVTEPEAGNFVPDESATKPEQISFAEEKIIEPEPEPFVFDEAVQESESIESVFEEPIIQQNSFSFSEPEPIVQPKIEFSEPESEQVIPELNFEANTVEAEEIFNQSFDEPYVYIPESEAEPAVNQEPIHTPQEEVHSEAVTDEPKIAEPVFEEPVKEETKETYATNPLEPTLINQAKISKTKGFYLIKYENETALVGYIKDEVFLIHSFKDSTPKFVQTRLTEKKRGADVYLVRSSDYKALIQVSKDNMQTLINL